MERELAQFKLDDGTAFLVEVDKPQPTSSGSIQRVASVNTKQMVYQATQTLDQALDSIKPVASTVVSRFKSGLTQPADEVEVTFGLKLSAEAGVVFGSVGGEVTFEVKLKWERIKRKHQPVLRTRSKHQLVPMEFEASKRAIAQIHYNNSDNIAGTGYLVAERYLLTCAHVVKEALFAPEEAKGQSLSVTFFGTTKPQQAEVICYDFDESAYGADAAVLYLSEDSQSEGCPASLSSLRELNDAELRVFGFPNNDKAGRNLIARTRGEVSGGWVQVVNAEALGLAIEGGFSGSPVWSDAEQGIVGMVVARHDGRDSAQVGFIIPVQKLNKPLLAIQQHSLLQLLLPAQDILVEQLTTAYKVCRPDTWPAPFENDLERRLADMTQMSASKLVEFAACLLTQPKVDRWRVELTAWIEDYKDKDTDLASLLKQMAERQQQVAPQRTQVANPCLLIRIQADKATKKEPYKVDAWLIPNSNRYDAESREGYNPQTGEGAEPLTFVGWERFIDDPDSVDLTTGIRSEHFPLLLANYVDQVACRDISFRDLTIEFFLPLPLINEAIEQCSIPMEFGLPAPLGIDEKCPRLDETCPHVVIRSQERLDFTRGFKLWESKWEQLQRELKTAAIAAFVDGNELSPKQLQTALMPALGLKLTNKLPKATNQGEIGILLATGTPAAVWIRRQDAPHVATNLETEILNGCLEQVPHKVCCLRRNTSELDEDLPPGTPLELGHHLSFLWEDFYRVPPSFNYSDAKL